MSLTRGKNNVLYSPDHSEHGRRIKVWVWLGIKFPETKEKKTVSRYAFLPNQRCRSGRGGGKRGFRERPGHANSPYPRKRKSVKQKGGRAKSEALGNSTASRNARPPGRGKTKNVQPHGPRAFIRVACLNAVVCRCRKTLSPLTLKVRLAENQQKFNLHRVRKQPTQTQTKETTLHHRKEPSGSPQSFTRVARLRDAHR